ncbi:MAG: hypothetical protein BGN88_09890 [Clostridiales bacterium 43-6]|nr:MAG: hypothetical protein BGN88_09890 [Clostridiales bacterium 43-6]
MGIFLSYFILLSELGFTLAAPFFLSKVIDASVYKSNMTLFIKASIFYALIFFSQQICSYLQLHFWQKVNNKFVKILLLKSTILANIDTGDLIHT